MLDVSMVCYYSRKYELGQLYISNMMWSTMHATYLSRHQSECMPLQNDVDETNNVKAIYNNG